MISLGKEIGQKVRGGEVIQLISDLGGGKTTLTKGIAAGLGVKEPVTSPSFTVTKEYDGAQLRLHHYDFYRLEGIGILTSELAEALQDKKAVIAIEWAKESIELLPKERTVTITITPSSEDENTRVVAISAPDKLAYIYEVSE